LPSGDLWLHEIKHDGFRIIARKNGNRVRLYTTRRFPLIAEALTGPAFTVVHHRWVRSVLAPCRKAAHRGLARRLVTVRARL
jgi:hypothetical protein